MKNPCKNLNAEYERVRPVVRMSSAELLLVIADFFGERRYVDDGTGMTAAQLALVDLAIKFKQRTDLILPAIVEGWDRPRIIREMF